MRAQEVNALLLHLSSGSQILFQLDENPIVSFQEDNLLISTNKNVVTYCAADVQRFSYITDPSGIITKDIVMPKFSIIGNLLVVNGLEPSSKFKIYSDDGILQVSSIVDIDGNTSVNIPNIQGKIYIVKTANSSFKISKP